MYKLASVKPSSFGPYPIIPELALAGNARRDFFAAVLRRPAAPVGPPPAPILPPLAF